MFCKGLPCNWYDQGDQVLYCLRNNYTMLLIHYTQKTLLRRFTYGCNLNIAIYIFYYCVSWGETDRKNITYQFIGSHHWPGHLNNKL